MNTQRLVFLSCAFFYANILMAQTDSAANQLSKTDVNAGITKGLYKQYGNLESKLKATSLKMLSSLQREEDKVHNKLLQIDTIKAVEIFSNEVKDKYNSLQSKIPNSANNLKQFPLKEYIPGIDSVQTALGFLINNPNITEDHLHQLQSLTHKLNSLQDQLQKANDAEAFVQERETYLKEYLLNSGFTKQLKTINKKVYYYQVQLREYKSLLNDKEKFKEKLLSAVRSLPAFQKFWEKNSYFSSLFPMSANSNAVSPVTGLQTRANVQNQIAKKTGTSTQETKAQQYFQAQIDAAQAQLNQFKNKLNQYANDGGNGDMTMPDFKPNDQKTKSLNKRLEYGFNIQSESKRYFLPAITDFALTWGYKLSDTKRAGIGISYKMGWGNGFRNIHITNEGVGLRSYLDIKVPNVAKGKVFGGLWFSGGFEYNYLSSFKSIQELHNNIDTWQRSALLGLTKKYKLGKKEGNIQLLYDFLHNQQKPPGMPIKFRIGYNF